MATSGLPQALLHLEPEALHLEQRFSKCGNKAKALAFRGPVSDLLSQKLWAWDPASCVSMSPPVVLMHLKVRQPLI